MFALACIIYLSQTCRLVRGLFHMSSPDLVLVYQRVVTASLVDTHLPGYFDLF